MHPSFLCMSIYILIITTHAVSNTMVDTKEWSSCHLADGSASPVVTIPRPQRNARPWLFSWLFSWGAAMRREGDALGAQAEGLLRIPEGPTFPPKSFVREISHIHQSGENSAPLNQLQIR